MAHQDRSRTMFLSVFVVAYLTLGGSYSPAQSSTPAAQDATASAPGEHIVPRIVRVGPDDPSFPIGRLTILYDGKPVKYGTYFDAPDDWLRHVSVSFQNRSAKTLIAGFLQIDFRQLGGDPLAFYFVQFGLTPEHQLYTRSGQPTSRQPGETPFSLAPGATGTISLERYYPGIRAAIETRGTLAQLTYCHVEYGAFYFDDDLRWMRGAFTRADPTKPGEYIPTPPEDFMPKP